MGKMEKTALIICNGEPPSRALARKLAAQVDLIVAADGGADVARRFGIRPHVIIGDLDSITAATKRFFTPLTEHKGLKPLRVGSEGDILSPRPLAFASLRRSRKGRGYSHTQIIQVSRQDNTDLEKALNYLLAMKVKRVSIIGATGNRIDFTLGNFSVIWNYANKMEISLVGDGWRAMPVKSGRKIVAKPGSTISLIPFGVCSGITLTGLRYPLTNATMRVGEIGVSNVVEKSPFSVTVRRGNMLLFIMNDT
jgi:thiamine pyrophosphokinase